jgi:hypothetical protein
MKNLLSLLTILVFFGANAQVPNLGFENWTPYSLGEYPTGWTTSDSVAYVLTTTNNVTKGTDPFEGSYSLHMRSVTSGFGISGPGIATNGAVNLVGTSFEFSGGSADTARYRYMTGQFKYMPMNPNDTGLATVILYRTVAGIRDTTAMGIYKFAGTTSNYTPFTVELHYRDYANHPEMIIVVLQSSKGVNDPNLALNTELVIDSINFSGFVGIDELADNISSLNFYPTPASSELHIDVELKKQDVIHYEIYDERGRLVLQNPLNTGHETADISQLAVGNYVLRIANASRNLYSGNFTITR